MTLYRLATALLWPLVLGYFYWRGRREPAYREHWRERLGWGLDLPRGVIWVHAASVGEVVLVTPLVEALGAAYPGRPLLLTTMTPTGRARAQARFGDRVHHHYVPLDTPGATKRFVRACKPHLAVFTETELWPNLIAAAAGEGVPLVLVNASISGCSAARYARWPLAPLLRFMLAHVAAIGAASAEHAQRFRALGAPPACVRVTGNLKYDVGTDDDRDDQAKGAALRAHWHAQDRPLLVAASTHPGEETLLLEAFADVRREQPAALLVIAPRHPQRFDAVAAELQSSGWRIARRSYGEAVGADTGIVLADTLGEVPLFYSAADVVFVGGSMVPGIGGHNVIEAAASGRPLCVGPHVADWRDIVDALVACGAARVCETPKALARQFGAWFDDIESARVDGAAGVRMVRANQGALACTLALVQSCDRGAIR